MDFQKSLKQLYRPLANAFSEIVVPPMRYMMVDGAGNPNTSPDYRHAVESLYGLAFPLKFASKKALGRDYAVPPLEGLWWAKDMAAFTGGQKDDWHWTMMIMVWILMGITTKSTLVTREKLRRKS